jgi:hypothetical protein
MKFLFDMLVVDNSPLDEDIIKYAHRLLMAFSEHEKSGGVYRQSDEAASHGIRLETDAEYKQSVKDAKRLKPNRPPPERTTKPLFSWKFVRGGWVPIYMKRVVELYNSDIQTAMEKDHYPRPIDLAAKYCNFFVCIHPFEDGNGRMCRLIMNTILLEYASSIVAIGVGVGERERYLEQAFKANTKQDQDDVSWDEQSSHHDLRVMIMQKMSFKL